MKCLVLNYDYSPINFTPIKKVVNKVLNNRVDVISYWNDTIPLVNGEIKIPSIVRVKHYVKWLPKHKPYSRNALFKRDYFCCQYCGKSLTPSESTVDHVHPQSKGGQTNWLNCVTCCHKCNGIKANKTLEEVGFKLLSKPQIPNCINIQVFGEYHRISDRHSDWQIYLARK
jgi:5-methylcytosine-specific restriction endonuclease McrA